MSASLTPEIPRSVWLSAERGTALIDGLFNRMDGIYPTRFRAAFKTEQGVENWRRTWADALAEEAISPDEVRRGIARCRRAYDWPPTLPEFLRCCRPGLDPKAAWAEAVEQMRIRHLAENRDTWSDPRIYWAAVKIGAHDLNALGWDAIRARWERALLEAGREPVPMWRFALPCVATTTRGEAQKRLAEIRKVLGWKH